ncbi:MAG: TIGR02677 family protein [Egibacteraceae bacterium]
MERLKTFTYVTVEKAWLYRAVAGAFTAAKESFAFNLRPDDVLAALAQAPLPGSVDRPAVDAALAQLVEWGNLSAQLDTAEVATVEDFNRERLLYHLTPAGQAAERALAVFDTTLRQPGELQAAALGDIRDLLRELADLAAQPSPDAGKIHRSLTTLRARFDELAAQAQTFMGSLQRTIDLHGVDLDAFLAYKDTLMDYLERFIGQLVIRTGEIAAAIADVERGDLDAVLTLAAERDLADALSPTPEDRAAALARWRRRWSGLRAWFLREHGQPSQAEVLRARARSAIPALLDVVRAIHDRRVLRTDRVADLRALACWFAQADTDTDAHRLWRAAFGLAPARHLRIDADTLDARDAQPVSAQASWLDAPPLRLSPRLRATGRHARRGGPAGVIDRGAEKALLRAQADAEAAQLAAARDRLLTGGRIHLSQLGWLDPYAFGLFCDLLGDALTRKVRPADRVRTVSADGTLVIALEPVPGGGQATIHTSHGTLTGPDHWLDIRDALTPYEELAS